MNIYSQVKKSEKLFDQVVLLGNKNSKTLGLLPISALADYANKGQIICASKNGTLYGYVLFAITQRKSRIRIVHLCVDEKHRKSGIANGLLNQVKDKYKTKLRGIALSCREDYREVNKFWEKYGFKPLERIRSRSKAKRYLIKWWYNFGNHDLFTIANSNSQNAKVLLDTNIIVKLRDDNEDETSGANFLLADWIVDEVDYYFASEIYNEINRDEDKQRAKQTRSFLTNFHKVLTTPSEVEIIFNELTKLVKGSSVNDISDKKQIAECISGGLDYFITTDINILNHEEQIYEKYAIAILSPSEFVLMIDKMVNHLNYNTARLAGANYDYRNPDAHDISRIINEFIRKEKGEKKNDLRDCLSKHIGDTKSTRIKIVQHNESLTGIWLANIADVQIQIKLLRTSKDKLSKPLFNQLLNNIINLAIDLEKREILIEEKYLSVEDNAVIEHFGFSKTTKGYKKLILNQIINSSELIQIAQSKEELDYFQNIIKKLNTDRSAELIHLIERKLWPLKFNDIDIPTYIVPIKPFWASQLFDHIAASATMFGSQPQLVWNRENIYYRSVNPVSEKVPARILWYVSTSKNSTNREKAIVASSYLDEVIIDEAKKLYKQYKSYGIYQWKDIFKLAKNDITKEIKALKFSDTEVFKKPVKLNKVNEILVENERKMNTFASPLEVSNKIFIDIYKEGISGY